MKISLTEVCDFQGGTQPPKNEWIDHKKQGYVRMLQIRDFTQSEKENIEYVKDTKNLKKCSADDILIGRYGASVGKILTGLSGAYNVAIVKVIPDRNKLYFRYLFHYFNSLYFQNFIRNVGSRAAQAGFNKNDLDNAFIPILSLDEQRKIAAVLDKVSDLIAKRRQQFAKLDELVKSRFIEMFGIPGTDEFGWGLVTLNSVCSINPKKSQDKRLGSGMKISFVPMPAVTETGRIDATAIREYNEVKTGFTYFAENDVLFAKITPCMENGKGAVAKGLCNGIGFGSTEFHVLRPINGRTNSYWLYMLTVFPQFRVDAAKNMTGSAGQRRVPASFLENYRISVPPIELQQQFAAFVEQTDKSKYCCQNCMKQYHVIKNYIRQEGM